MKGAEKNHLKYGMPNNSPTREMSLENTICKQNVTRKRIESRQPVIYIEQHHTPVTSK